MVGQSGGPTAVINASLAGVYHAAKEAGIPHIYGMQNGIEGLLQGRYLDLKNRLQTAADLELLKRTPAAYLGSCRFKMPKIEEAEEVYQNLFEILKSLDIKYFFYIGGNDSMDTILKLSDYGTSVGSPIRFIGVPKTIDNDLAITDHTPGFGSAAKYVAATMKEIIRDSNVYDMESVTVVEIMGRNAGWLTASSILSKGEDCPGPDLIYLPESPFDIEDFLEKINNLRKEKKTIVVAVSESLKDKDGNVFCAKSTAQTDSFGHNILSGTALHLSDIIHERLQIKSRGIVLNTLQRCAAHFASYQDMTEAFTAGTTAVQAAIKGQTGEMIIFRRINDAPYQMVAESYDIHQVANEEKTVPKEWIINDGTYIAEDFITYCRPLILGEVQPFMAEGLPLHLK